MVAESAGAEWSDIRKKAEGTMRPPRSDQQQDKSGASSRRRGPTSTVRPSASAAEQLQEKAKGADIR